MAALTVCGTAIGAVKFFSAPAPQTAPEPPAVQTKVDACGLSGINAADDPTKVYMIPPGGFAESYINADKIFRKAMHKMGRDVPAHIDARFLGMVGEMESLNGVVPYTEGNSYIGIVAIAPNRGAGTSHFAEFLPQILKVLNTAKADIPILRDCGAITREVIVDSAKFPNPLLQGLFMLTMANESHARLAAASPVYADPARLTADQKRAALYVYYNIAEVAKFALTNIDSKHPVRHLLAKSKRSDAVRLATFMDGNLKVYPVKATPRGLLQNFLEQTKDGATMVANYRPDIGHDARANAQAITNFLKRYKRFGPGKPAKPEASAMPTPVRGATNG